MKAFTLLCASVLFAVPSMAQLSHFSKGQATAQLGIGFVSPLLTELGADAAFTVPPLSGSVEFAVSDEIAVGGYLGFAKNKVSDSYYVIYSNGTIQERYGTVGTVTHFIIGARGTYHFGLLDKFDTYAGGMLGYNALRADEYVPGSLGGAAKGFTYSVMAGGRYSFGPSLGAFAELGYGVAVLNLGLTLKLK